MLNRIDDSPLSLRLSGLALAAWVAFSTPTHAGPYLLVEADSGRVIAESDAGRPWYPASVTKLMTAYLAFEAMRQGKAEPLTLLTVSANALAQPPSKMGFKVGTQVTLDNAIKMLMVRSANDVAIVVAEGIGGSVEAFVQDMNMTAQRLGMSGTHFVNPHGLPAENQFTTARDMAILSLALIREFPEYELYFRIPAIQIGKRVIRTHNRLIDRYAGADGMKTGFICSSGYNMVAAAKRGDKRMIAVVFGAYSSGQRAEDAARLLERGFRRDPTVSPDEEFGTLHSIRNLVGEPYDMRDEVCNRKRRRPVAESDIDEDDEEADASATDGKTDEKSDANSKQAKTVKKPPRPSLLGPLTPSMPPILVYTGLPYKAPEENIVPMPPARLEASAPAKPEKAAASTKPNKPKAQPRSNEKSATQAGGGSGVIGAAQAAPASSAKSAPRAPATQPKPSQ